MNRPISLLLAKLVKYKRFREASNYFNNMNTEEGLYKDILEGSVAVEYMEEMRSAFEAKRETLPANCVMPNHLLSEFYDGAKLFDNRQSNFHALIIQLLTLPPTYRVKNGCGSFVISTHNIGAGSIAERTMIYKFFVEDLKLLKEGFVKEIDGISYFIQGRLNNHLWDTIAFAANACVKVNNAKEECIVCGGIHGIYRHSLHHCYYMGHRRCLPINNRLRWYGTSRRCCPLGYYSGDAATEAEVNRLFVSTNTDDVPQRPRTATYCNYHPGQTVGCDNPSRQLEISMRETEYYVKVGTSIQFAKGNSNNQWFHEKEYPFDATGFHQYLSYPHLDLRKELEISHITNEEFNERGVQALIHGGSYRGVHKPWPFKDLTKWNHVTFESFHALKNVCDNIIALLKGKAGATSYPSRKLCKAEGVHPCLWSPNIKSIPLWQLSDREMAKADAIMATVRIPFGYKGTSQIYNPFRQTGNLTGMQLITLVTTYLSLLVTFSSIHNEYKVFISMLSSVLNDLMAPRITDEDVSWISNRIYELVALKEGLFPDSEAKIVWHQLTDLPDSIHLFGPILCWWALPGEREIGSLKRYLYA